jgi:hypothetical protein
MAFVITYLLAFLAALGYLLFLWLSGGLPPWMGTNNLWFLCGLAGGVGGCVYCLRGVYLNACVKKQWDKDWLPWYFIRPFVSLICGAVSCLFLKAGLLVLEASKEPSSTNLGFVALAFIAGLNVDKFISKIEDIAQATWGIEKSRSAKEAEDRPASKRDRKGE